MQQFVEYLAIIAFMAVYFITRDIFLATGVLIAGVTLQIVAFWVMKKPIGMLLKVTFWASVILGGITILFRDETFIMWKPSIVYWIMAAALLGGHLIKRTYLIKHMLASVLDLPDDAWFVLTYGWVVAFVGTGFLNLYVAYNFSLDTWVTFKLVGLILLNIVFMVATFGYLYAKGLLSEENLKEPPTSTETSQESS